MTEITHNFDLSDDVDVVSEEGFIGELPKANEPIPGVVKRLYLSFTQSGKPILKPLYVCTEGKYAGYSAWDNITLTDRAAFKWKPFIKSIGVSTEDLNKRIKTEAEVSDESIGRRILSIGDVKFTDDAELVPITFAVKYRRFEGVTQTDVVGVKPRTGQRHVSDTKTRQPEKVESKPEKKGQKKEAEHPF